VLAALAPDVVVHLGTTSKILTPTLGVGWMVAPPPVAEAVLAYRERTGTRPSPAGQRVFTAFARNGDLGRHLRRVRRELSERRQWLVAALTEAGVPVLGDDAGAHLVVPMATPEEEQKKLAAAAERGILLDGLARHFAAEPTVFGVAIGYAGCSRAELYEAIPAVIDVLRSPGGPPASG